MRAAGAVDEVQVEVERLVVAGEPGREAALHPVEEQGLEPIGPGGPADGRARQRRDEDLGLETGGEDLRGLADLGREHTVLDEEDVAVEAGALVARPHLRDDAVDADLVARGEHALEGDDVVELQDRALGHRHPEVQRRGVLRAEHAAGQRLGGGGLVRRDHHADATQGVRGGRSNTNRWLRRSWNVDVLDEGQPRPDEQRLDVVGLEAVVLLGLHAVQDADPDQPVEDGVHRGATGR